MNSTSKQGFNTYILYAIAGVAISITLLQFAHSARVEDDETLMQAIIDEIKSVVSAKSLDAQIIEAINNNDIDTAGLLLDAGRMVNVKVSASTQDAYDSETTPFRNTLRLAKECGSGFVFGDSPSLTGISCAVVSDFTLVGDVRDGGSELWKMAKGEEPDSLILGLATAGVALSLAAPASGGTSLGAKAGTSVIKTTAKAAVLSRRMLNEIKVVIERAVDLRPVRESLKRNPRELTQAVKQAVDLEKLAPLSDAGKSLKKIYDLTPGNEISKGRNVVMILKNAERFEDLKKSERLH